MSKLILGVFLPVLISFALGTPIFIEETEASHEASHTFETEIKKQHPETLHNVNEHQTRHHHLEQELHHEPEHGNDHYERYDTIRIHQQGELRKNHHHIELEESGQGKHHAEDPLQQTTLLTGEPEELEQHLEQLHEQQRIVAEEPEEEQHESGLYPENEQFSANEPAQGKHHAEHSLVEEPEGHKQQSEQLDQLHTGHHSLQHTIEDEEHIKPEEDEQHGHYPEQQGGHLHQGNYFDDEQQDIHHTNDYHRIIGPGIHGVYLPIYNQPGKKIYLAAIYHKPAGESGGEVEDNIHHEPARLTGHHKLVGQQIGIQAEHGEHHGGFHH